MRWRSSRLVSVVTGLAAVALGGAVALAQVAPQITRPTPWPTSQYWCEEQGCSKPYRSPRPGTSPPPPPPPPASTPAARPSLDPSGVPHLDPLSGRPLTPGQTYRLGDFYYTVPANRLLRPHYVIVDPGGGRFGFIDVMTGSTLGVDPEGGSEIARVIVRPGSGDSDARIVRDGSDPDGAGAAFDELLRSIRRAP